MKIWVDDVRQAPDSPDWIWCRSVNEAKHYISVLVFQHHRDIDLIDIDHDAGDFYSDGGDYVRLLDWLEQLGFNIPIKIHSMNPVGVENMRWIIQRNGWIEVR